MDDRPSWDDYFLGIARAVSARGDCSRSRVGAVIVDADNVIVATGYNGHEAGGRSCLLGDCPRGRLTYEQSPPGGSYENCTAWHAEENALKYASIAGQIKRLQWSTAYITRAPCEQCQVKLAWAGVQRVVW